MLTKTITFEGLEGPITETYLFHITQAQILELNLPYINEDDADPDAPSGMAKALQTIIDTNDNLRIYQEFKRIVLMAVGKKSEDGKRFLKTEEIRQDFENTEAYSELIIELMEDPEKAAKFFQGIMPAKLQEEAARQNAVPSAVALAESIPAPPPVAPEPTPVAPAPTPPSDARVVSQAELGSIDPAELQKGLADGTIVIQG